MLCGLDAIDVRHANVEQDHVGVARGQHLERLPAGGGFARDLERQLKRAIGQKVAQAIARRRFIIDHQHAQRLFGVHPAPAFR